MTLNREGFLSCPTCCDTAPHFSRSHPKKRSNLVTSYDRHASSVKETFHRKFRIGVVKTTYSKQKLYRQHYILLGKVTLLFLNKAYIIIFFMRWNKLATPLPPKKIPIPSCTFKLAWGKDFCKILWLSFVRRRCHEHWGNREYNHGCSKKERILSHRGYNYEI